ncbi:MAG: family 20 glycosylhydrolase [Steroidobacteraceae bacterium]
MTAKQPAGTAAGLLFALYTCCVPLVLCAQATPAMPLPMMPWPAHVAPGNGEFAIDGSFGIRLSGYREPRLERAQQRFLDVLSRATGIPLWREARINSARFTVETAAPSAPVQRLGEDESYHLEVTATGVRLAAPNPLGVLRGLQTFLQLVRVTPAGFSVPAVIIDDVPRFPWRGLLIDAGHRFVPVEVIKRNLDGMEAVKLDVFHWRFADDQGFHIESKVFPLLQQQGSGGVYYTQDEVREVVAYARDRGIRVVPEFDMPCHAGSWFAGYPQLAGGRDAQHSSAMDPTREETYRFLARFIAEMAALFPDEVFHTGGDECDPSQWTANPRILEWMHAHAIADGAALQDRFTTRVHGLVAAQHKTMAGWDEVLRTGTPTDVIIQSWRGSDALAAAARRGNRGVLSFGYYIDLNQSAAEHYRVDPLDGDADTLDETQRARVLGGEPTMWTDVLSHENIDNRIWPRTAAIAERLWSPRDVQDTDSMYERMAIVSQQLVYHGLRPGLVLDDMLQRMTGQADPAALKVLAAVVQPPRNYERQSLREYSDFTPLNRLVDAVPPESETARAFGKLVGRIAAGKGRPDDWEQAQRWLALWRDNDAALQPQLAHSFLTQELAPLSRNLADVARLGLQALDDLRHDRGVGASDRRRDLDFLQASAQPQAVLLLMVVPAVRSLVLATREKSE